MPVVEIKVMEGVFTHEEKHRIVEGVSEALIELTGEWTRPYTHAFITEAPNGDWAISGSAKSAEDIKAMRHGSAVPR